MTEKKYVNGIFIQEKSGQYGKYLSIGITEEGMKALASLEKNDKGVRNFIATPQQRDAAKFSARWPKNAPSSSQSQGNDAPPPSEEPVNSDELPF